MSKGKVVFLLLAAVSAFSGCSQNSGLSAESELSPPAQMEKSASDAIVLPHSMGVTQFTFSDGTVYEVELEMIEGTLLKDTDENFCPGGGILDGENYIGKFRLTAKKHGKEVCALDCGEYILHGPVSLEPYDYNGDGSLEFTLGRWGSSSLTMFSMYSLSDDGTISLLQTEIPDNGMAVDTKKFTTVDKGFTTEVYNNADGSTDKLVWTWDGEKFVETKK